MVPDEPDPVCALEFAKVADPLLEFLTGLDERAHELTVPPLGIALERLGAQPCIVSNQLGLLP